MRSTMQQVPLQTSRILEYGTTAFAGSEVITWGAAGPRRSSYAEVGRDCRRLANALRRLGVDSDQRVGTFMWNNEEHLELYLTVPSMGAVLHTINIRLFPAQVVYVINHAADQVVVVDASLAEPFSALLPEVHTVRHVVVNGPVPDTVRAALAGEGERQVHDYRALLDAEPDRFTWPVVDENSAAAMCYTSGTTGNPKGVAYSHRSTVLHTMLLGMPTALSLSEADRLLAVVPLFHANAWGMAHASMFYGSTLVMPDRFLQAAPLAEMISTVKVTKAGAVPTVVTDLLRYIDEHPELDLSSLRSMIVGGSACPPALMRAYEERHGVRILHAWGMTEMSPLGTVAVPPAAATGEEAWSYRESQGRLAGLVEGRLIGPDGAEVPWDGQAVGELEVRGPWVTGSYYAPEGAAEVSPETFHDSWMRTGDVGTLSADGFLRLSDRSKDVIKSGGEWISSVDLENHLMAHPKVKEATVVGVPDDRWGERPLAAVVPLDGSQLEVEELRGFLAERVARWQVPDRWAFVTEVPKTSVGKFDKKALRRSYADGELDVTTLS